MFTGIIEETGTVAELTPGSAGARLRIEAAAVLADLRIGGSIAVNGCCLTAVEIASDGFAADLSPETLDKTNLGDPRPGDLVNLERPLLPTSRLGGHFVLGHVDGTGEFIEARPLGEGNRLLRVRVPSDLEPLLVYKGSIAADGVSLTIARLDRDIVEIAVIPHTWQATNLAQRRPGDRVNIECDMIAKHVERLYNFSRK